MTFLFFIKANDTKKSYDIAQIRAGVSTALNKIVVTEEPLPQVYTTPNREQKTPEHTGHVPPEVQTGTPPFDTEAGRETVEGQQHTGHQTQQEVDWRNYVMEARISRHSRYSKNAAPVPDEHQTHHLISDAKVQKSDLAMEAMRRKKWHVDDGSNLINLPNTQDAYDNSTIKIRHAGRHTRWNNYAGDVLEKEEIKLENRYGDIQKVPDNVLEQTMDRVENKLRREINDVNLGKREGWIKKDKYGMDKISLNRNESTIG